MTYVKKATVALRYYSRYNLGDDLFVRIVSERYPSVLFKVPTGQVIQGLSNVKRSNLLADLAYRIISKITGDYLLHMSELTRKSDLMLFVGGSIFIEQNNLQTWRREARFYQKLSIPYYIIGSNIGPYTSFDFLEIVRGILVGANDACLRDGVSYSQVKDIQSTRLATDIAFTLDTSSYVIGSEKLVIFSLIDGSRKFDEGTTRKYEAEVLSMTSRLVDEGYKVIYMSFCEYEGDELANKRIFELLPYQVQKQVKLFKYRGNLSEALDLISSSEIIIGTRFHAVILGLLFGKKVLPIAYSDKTTDILKDMNFKGPVVDIRKIDMFDGEKFNFSLLEINDVSDQIKLAEEQFQELDKVLTKR